MTQYRRTTTLSSRAHKIVKTASEEDGSTDSTVIEEAILIYGALRKQIGPDDTIEVIKPDGRRIRIVFAF